MANPPNPPRPAQVSDMIAIGEQLENIMDSIRSARNNLITFQDAIKPAFGLDAIVGAIKMLRTEMSATYSDANDIRTAFWKAFDTFEQREIARPNPRQAPPPASPVASIGTSGPKTI